MGLAARVAAYRPYFQVVSFLSLSASYYWIYKKHGHRPRRITLIQLLLWAATVLFLGDLALNPFMAWLFD